MAFTLSDLNAFTGNFQRASNELRQRKDEAFKRRIMGAQAQLAEEKAQMYPQQEQAAMELEKAKIAQMEAPRGPSPSTYQITPGQNGELYRINKLTGAAQMIKDEQGNPVTGQQKGGITVGMDAQGRPLVSIGGTGGASGRGVSSLMRSGGVVQTPQGPTLIPGSASKRKIFDSTSAINTILPFVKDLKEVGKQYPYYNESGSNSSWDLGLNKIFMGNAPIGIGSDLTPRQRLTNSAAVHQKATEILEQMMSSLNIQKSDKGMQAVESMVYPHPGMPKEAYEANIDSLVHTLVQKALSNQRNVQGIPLRGDEASLTGGQ